MYDQFYSSEYLMKAREQELQKSARQAWKWSTVKSKVRRPSFINSLSKNSPVYCCTQPIQACC